MLKDVNGLARDCMRDRPIRQRPNENYPNREIDRRRVFIDSAHQ